MEALERVFGRTLLPLGSFLCLSEIVGDHELNSLLFEHVWTVPSLQTNGRTVEARPDGTAAANVQSFIVETLVRRALSEYGEEGHMLCCGYRWAGKGNFETKIAGGALEAKFPNWIVAYLKSPVWGRLLIRIGEARMRQVLWEVPVLVYKKDRVLVQLSGRPLPALVTVRDLEQHPKNATLPLRSLVSTKASDSRNSKQVGWSLPANHPLVSRPSEGPISRTRARDLALAVASIRVDGKVTGRLSEAQHHRLALPWSKNLHRFQRMLLNTRNCVLTRLYDQARRAHNAPLAEDSEALMGSLRRTDVPKEVIAAFVKSAARRIVPRPFWGTRHTRRCLLSALEDHVARCVVGEPPLWVEVLHGLDPDDFPWLRWCSTPRKRKRALQQWLCFLLDRIAGDIVRACFTVIRDETNQAVFYTARAWESAKATEIASELKRFEPVPSNQASTVEAILAKRKFSMPLARFVRKKRSGDLRLILNMASKVQADKMAPNQYLRPAFHALSCELERDPSLGGAFVQGLENIHERYRAFILRHRQNTSRGLFAVAMDVRKCFDTMRHDRLLQCVKQALRSDEYAISSGRSVTFLDNAQRSIRTKRVRTARPSHMDTLPSLDSLKQEAALQNRPSIITDSLLRQFVSRDRVLECVSELIHGTYIRVGAKRFRMAEGVAQGSVISTLLCRLYYGAFERDRLAETFKEDEDLVMRMVDDYIVFSPNCDRTQAFKNEMSRGHEDWGCFVNEDKTREASSLSAENRWIMWCGLRFDLRSGEVRMNFDAEDVFSPARAFQRGLGRTMRAAFAVKCRALLLDPIINSLTNILINIGQTMVVCAVRCLKYCAFAARMDGSPRVSTEGILADIIDLFIFAHALIASRAHKVGVVTTLADVQAVGWFAFKAAFTSNASELAEIISERSEGVLFLRRSSADWTKVEACIRHVARVL